MKTEAPCRDVRDPEGSALVAKEPRVTFRLEAGDMQSGIRDDEEYSVSVDICVTEKCTIYE
jgi:hypothetical protein